jgi:AcrR family transcriptional regulator
MAGETALLLEAPPPKRGGRPSKAEAEQLGEHILDVATELFLANGYGATSIEAVAQRAHVAKRTLYTRFDDKPALFAAVMHRIVERLHPTDGMPLYGGGSCEIVLLRLARLLLRGTLTPQALALTRLLLAEAERFPELTRVVTREGASTKAALGIAQFLEAETRAGRLNVRDPVFAAEQFIQMVIAVPQRRAHGMGAPMSEDELDRWALQTVDLFLTGCRGG